MKLNEFNNVIDISKLSKELFKNIINISIDYAILEKTNKAYVIEAPLKWSDVGSYLYLEEVLEKDENNNVIKNANYVGIDSSNNIIVSDENININVSLLGVENMIISITKDDVLIINKKDINKMKDLIKKVEQ
jgi:mannose-1-phosphate guanylyltransferase